MKNIIENKIEDSNKEKLRKISSLMHSSKHDDLLKELQKAFHSKPPFNKACFVKLYKFSLAKENEIKAEKKYNDAASKTSMASIEYECGGILGTIPMGIVLLISKLNLWFKQENLSKTRYKLKQAKTNLFIAEFKNKGELKLEIAIVENPSSSKALNALKKELKQHKAQAPKGFYNSLLLREYAKVKIEEEIANANNPTLTKDLPDNMSYVKPSDSLLRTRLADYIRSHPE